MSIDGCKIDGCDRAASASFGWCVAHYTRYNRHGDPLGAKHRPDYRDAPCAISWCDNPRSSVEELCATLHARRKRKGVSLTQPKQQQTPEGTPLSERLQYEIQPGGCWEWTGTRLVGYGVLEYQGKQLKAHRVSLALHLSEAIPDDLFVCHTCDNPPCINPEHLYVGTAKTNQQDAVSRGRNANVKKSHCPLGHEYDYVAPDGTRGCRTCRTKQAKACKDRKVRLGV